MFRSRRVFSMASGLLWRRLSSAFSPRSTRRETRLESHQWRSCGTNEDVVMTKNRPKPKNQTERKARVQLILKTLDEMYPDATCALIHRNPWELLVATILSAQCTDKRVNRVTPELFAKYPTPKDFAAA